MTINVQHQQQQLSRHQSDAFQAIETLFRHFVHSLSEESFQYYQDKIGDDEVAFQLSSAQDLTPPLMQSQKLGVEEGNFALAKQIP